MSMLSLRLPREMASSVKYWARRDGTTASEWIRKLVEAELATPNRQPPVDLSLYQHPVTAPSGAVTHFEWLTP